MRFDDQYREDVTLLDGTRARLRLVRPDDKQLLARSFAELSPAGRFLRFFSHKESLTAAELAYFTEMDQISHFAVGAVSLDESGDEDEGLGVARFAAMPGQPEIAEAAVAVADRMQKKGLGRLLFERLVDAALERGVARFRCEVLSANEGMRGLLERIAPGAQTEREGDVVMLEWPLDPDPKDRSNPLYRLLTMAAEGLVVVQAMLFGHEKKTDATAAAVDKKDGDA